ncbi:hypothetical protein [Spirosoma telluris]|uniref:hypothetical protein n=1 Tax=Spirosoma telluris TaxID=2183553 RepID=UPI002FC2E3C1
MNKIGMNMFVWTMTMDENLSDTLSFLKTSGFDFVEVPINDVNLVKWQNLGQQIKGLGLGVQSCTICGHDYSLISPNESVRRAAIDYLKQIVDCSQAVGSAILMGRYTQDSKRLQVSPLQKRNGIGR